MNVKVLAVKRQSNKVMYKILLVERGIYLPVIRHVVQVFITLIVTGGKSIRI